MPDHGSVLRYFFSILVLMHTVETDSETVYNTEMCMFLSLPLY